MQLKYLTLLSKEKANYRDILEERLGLGKVRWYHTLYFIKTFKKMVKEIEVLSNLDPKKVEESPDCLLIRPKKIDEISFGAMTELKILMQNPGDEEIGELIQKSIALTCYESHTKQKFDSDTSDFKTFETFVGEQNLVHMLGLHNWIDKELQESVIKWNRLFSQVEVHDEDWDKAGGAMMNKFDVLNTIKKTCSAFNLDYYRSIQIPFGLVQANALSDATRAFIQDKMRIAIEARMKSKRKES